MSKVILLAPTPPPVGGIATWAMRMLAAEMKHDWKTEVVDEKIIGKREVFGNKTKRNLLMEVKRCICIWKRLHHALKDRDALVVHSSIPAGTLPIMREYICACITGHYKRKFIVHFHCTVPNLVKSRMNRFVLKRICNKSDGIIVLNRKSADFVKEYTGKPIWIVPNFVDASELVEQHRIREDIKRAVYVGGVIESKGCMEILSMAKAYPNIQFRLVGKAESKISDAAAELPNVVLTGLLDRDGVRRELVEADVFLFLSYFPGEGFSCALTEAMAAGLPCLVSDWAANKDMIQDKGGCVVPVKDVKAAVAALEKMMPAQVRREQSVFNIQKVRTQYVDQAVLAQYVDCYEQVLKV